MPFLMNVLPTEFNQRGKKSEVEVSNASSVSSTWTEKLGGGRSFLAVKRLGALYLCSADHIRRLSSCYKR